MATTIQKLITPHDQFIRAVFSAPQFYLIDIYQREYKWTENEVKTLLNDLQLRFEIGQRLQVVPKTIRQDVLETFDPYFLNTYLAYSSQLSTSSQNLSSGDSRYLNRLDDYAKSYINWNEMLAGHLPTANVKHFPPAMQNARIPADPSGAFPKDKVEQRQRLFFEAFKAVWANV